MPISTNALRASSIDDAWSSYTSLRMLVASSSSRCATRLWSWVKRPSTTLMRSRASCLLRGLVATCASLSGIVCRLLFDVELDEIREHARSDLRVHFLGESVPAVPPVVAARVRIYHPVDE